MTQMKFGARSGIDNELTIIGHDRFSKRVVVRCSACDRTFAVGADAFASGGAHCGCKPCRPIGGPRWNLSDVS
jgi:hypothetical protein